MAFWNKFPYSNFHEINLDWIIREMKKISGSVSDFARQWEKALKQETGERQEADRQLQENIDAEQNRAEAAEEALGERIDQEIKDRQEADQAEQTAREEADRQLQDNIDAEQARAEAAEEALDQKIEAETSRAEAAEKVLDGKITAETARATGVENELRGLITTETERATAAEGALGDRIDGLEGELEGVTGADSPFIRKDGSTTTTGKIPLAQGGTSEVDPAAATDLVNLRSMQAADQALENSLTEYVDNQLEVAMGDVHSIPAGGTAGQVLGKKSATDYDTEWVDQTGGGTPGPEGPQGPRGPEGPQGPKGDPGPGVATGGTAGQVLSKVDSTDYNTQWTDPPSGSDPDAIKKDGTTTTTAEIPFAEGIGIDSDNYWTERDFVSLTSSDTGGYTQIQNSNGNVAALYATKPDGSAINNGVRVEPDGLQIMANEETGTSGQVLTANGDGTCRWGDAEGQASIIGSNDDLIAYRVGDLVLLYTNREFYYGITSSDLKGQSTLFNGYYYSHSESVSTSNLGFVFPTTGDYSTSSIYSYDVGATSLMEIHVFRVNNSITIIYRTMRHTQIAASTTVNMLIPDKTFIGSYVVPE